jgi:hypothetical protein
MLSLGANVWYVFLLPASNQPRFPKTSDAYSSAIAALLLEVAQVIRLFHYEPKQPCGFYRFPDKL